MGELDYVVCKMRNGRCADTDGLMAEMFKYASVETKRCDILKTGNLESSWRHSMFVMLPKSGDLSETNNWRPIAILKIAYKIFSSLLHLRLRRQLDFQQSVDQLGFWPRTSVDHAFVVLETVVSKTLEWQCGIWYASLDLRKAFDKVEHGALFAALTAQGIEDGYLDLLMDMYQDQTGAVPGSEKFSIQRGVRQGDVLRPLLFNDVLEDAIRKWILKLTNGGLRLGQDTRLTNLRYADDRMIFATSREELVSMVEMLVPELSLIGWQLNGTGAWPKCLIATHRPPLPLPQHTCHSATEVSACHRPASSPPQPIGPHGPMPCQFWAGKPPNKRRPSFSNSNKMNHPPPSEKPQRQHPNSNKMASNPPPGINSYTPLVHLQTLAPMKDQT